MATATMATLVDALRRYRLLEAVHLEELQTLPSRFSDPKSLTAELIRRGWLTPYQANQLFQGKGPDLLLGSYVLLERLGEGGMGEIFKARNWKLGRVVALKVIRRERLDNPDTVRRFEREVRAAAALDHPNIVRAFDADRIGGTHLLVMEYVAGATDLAHLVRQKGPLAVPQACDYVRQAALGLQHAHERGLVHRDVKPSNLLLTADGTVVKVLDMGLARLNQSAADDKSSTVTLEGTVMGTPDYMAPEQARESHAVDIRADLYSLGCTLYYLLTGRVPFPGGSFFQKVNRHQFEEPEPVERLRPEVPAEVAAVVRKLMAKRPEERYQTPGELAAALAALFPALAQAGGDSPTMIDPRQGPAVPPPETLSAALDFQPTEAELQQRQAHERQRGRREKRQLLLGALGGVVLLGLAAGLLAWLPRPEPTNPFPRIPGKTAEEEEARELDRWVRRVAALPAEEQVKAVAQELKRRNPAFDGAITPLLEDRKVLAADFRTDGVTDLAPVRGFPHLTTLGCFGSAEGKGQMVRLQPLRGLRLSTLKIWFNPRLADLRPVAGMPLASLNANGTAVADLSPLRDMPLADLRVAGTQIRTLEPLRGLPLVELDINNTAVVSLGPLQGMKVRFLACGNTRVSDLSPLAGMPIRHLVCNFTPVSDLSPLKSMPLEILRCDFKPERDAEILRAIPTLKTINDKPAKEFWKELDARQLDRKPPAR